MTKSRKSRNTAENSPPYTGRFAPSPTGPLHLGSLICALASYLDARSRGGRWLVRVEDLDPPREVAGAADQILESLLAHGLAWDDDLLWQSRRHAAYAEAVESLLQRDTAFYCDCTRAQLKAAGNVYRGRCRHRKIPAGSATAVRVRVRDDAVIRVDDRIQPPLEQHLARDVGDFIIRRKDGLFAYQLAVVLDDAWQGVTDVLRGSDLYDSTPRQVWLQRLLDLPTPTYAHIPVITNRAGQKLSKQTHAEPVESADALQNLCMALKFLGQKKPGSSHLRRFLDEAAAAWQPAAIARTPGIPEHRLY